MRRPTLLFLVVSALILSPLAFAKKTPATSTAPQNPCPSAREYITALEFMRSREDLSLPDPAAQKLAEKIAGGCAGAAKRFISTTALLREAELAPAEAVSIAAELALRTDADASNFAAVFRRAYAAEFLDLDLRSSLQMALELSTFLKSDKSAIRRDFEQLVDYCSRTKRLDLPRPQCGAFAMRITKKGEPWEGGVALPFQNAFDFLVSEKGPSLTTQDALGLAETLIEQGPGAVENFTQAYRYAVSSKGLGMSREQAIVFSRTLAQAGKKEHKTNQ